MHYAEIQPDVVVAGGGMVGAALAAALGDTLLQTRLVELRRREQVGAADPLERASLIAEGSLRFLRGLGVPVDELGTPVQRMRVWDAERFGTIQLDAEEVGAAELGRIVENRKLEQALHRALAGRGNVQVHYGAQVRDPWFLEDEITVEVDGQRWHTRLLAIAEGRESALRRALGIPTLRSDYQQLGIIATVQVERPHQCVAYQRFLPSGPLALLPFAPAPDGGPRCSMVWSARAPVARTLMNLEDGQFLTRLNETFGPQLGRIHGIGPRAAFPLSALHADSYIGRRSVLLGDTAHGVHPLAGLGVNLGLRDAACLAELVKDAARRGDDWGERRLLRRYETQRRPDNLATLAATDGINRLFSNDIAPMAWLRDLGMLATQVALPVKRFLIRQAMGIQ